MSMCPSSFWQNSKSNVCKWQRRTGDNVDGCGMFWKADKWESCNSLIFGTCKLDWLFIFYCFLVFSRFRLLEQTSIEFKEFGLRENVAQLSAFEVSNSCYLLVYLVCEQLSVKTHIARMAKSPSIWAIEERYILQSTEFRWQPCWSSRYCHNIQLKQTIAALHHNCFNHNWMPTCFDIFLWVVYWKSFVLHI